MVRVARGYTLIEVLIVVVILGIAGALVVPSIASADVLRVQAAVRTIVSDINFAQSDGLAHQEGRAIVFDPPTNRYALLEVHGPNPDPQTDTIYEVDLSQANRFHDARIDSAIFDFGSTLVFDEFGGPVTAPGSATPGNGGTITVSGSGSVFAITVEAYTGRVTVTRLQGS